MHSDHFLHPSFGKDFKITSGERAGVLPVSLSLSLFCGSNSFIPDLKLHSEKMHEGMETIKANMHKHVYTQSI